MYTLRNLNPGFETVHFLEEPLMCSLSSISVFEHRASEAQCQQEMNNCIDEKIHLLCFAFISTVEILEELLFIAFLQL